MSERYDSPKKPNGDSNKLLQKRIEKRCGWLPRNKRLLSKK